MDGAISCTGFRDDGALSSHRSFGIVGSKIGTKSDCTTSICSSSDSSDSFISIESLRLVERSLCTEDTGLDVECLDDVGDNCEELKCSGVRFIDSDEKLVLCMG